MWLSYYRLLPGSHSLFIILFEDDVPEPLPSPVFLLETFLGPARKSAHPGLLLDGTFFMSLYIMLKFRRLKVSIIIDIVPHFLVY